MLLSQKEDKRSFQKWIQKKIISPENLQKTTNLWKRQGKTLVTLNGSFDLLHPGHFEMLYQASCQGDLLLVLLNTDQSIQSYKSPFRPIHSLDVRIQQMAGLEMVDFVSWFDEDDPREILRKIQPNIHVNGSEYRENCIEADVVKENGGEVVFVDLIPGYSSTELIRKIQKRCD